MTTQDLQIGWIIRPAFRERGDVIYFQVLRLLTAFHASARRHIEKRENVVNSHMAAVLLAAIIAGCLYAIPSVPSFWIASDPVGYDALNGLLILVSPAFLVLTIAAYVVESPLLGALAGSCGKLGVLCVKTIMSPFVVNLHAFNAAASYALWGRMALWAWRPRKVSLEAALYGLCARDDFHATEIIP